MSSSYGRAVAPFLRCYLTISVTDAVCVSVPLTPLIRSVTTPRASTADVLTVMVCAPGAGAGLWA